MQDLNRLDVPRFQQKCSSAIAELEKDYRNNAPKIRNLQLLKDTLPNIDNSIYSEAYNVFDFMVKEKVFILDSNQDIQSELEYDIFNGVMVSEEVPFIIINSAKKEKIKSTSDYVSLERKYKIFNSDQENSNLHNLISKWSEEVENLEPNTLIMKVLTSDPRKTDISKVKSSRYSTFVYNIGERFSLKIPSNENSGDDLKIALENLNRSSNFEFRGKDLGKLNGYFPIDYFKLDKSIFRMILGRIFHGCLEISEKKVALSYQSQFKLTFKLGDIKQKILISTKETDLNNVYDQRGIPYTFKPGISINVVSMNEVNSLEDALLIKSILHCAFYYYCRPTIQGNNGPNSYSSLYALNMSIATGRTDLFSYKILNNTQTESFKITLADIKKKGVSKIKQLKIADPTFYERGLSSEISGKERQPELLVRTIDPNWENVVRQFVYGDEFKRRSIIRYPFQVVGNNPPSISTAIPPYFLISNLTGDSEDKSYLDLKAAKEPNGTKGSYHPYVIFNSTRKHLEVNGENNKEALLAFLLDLNTPFLVREIKSSDSRSNMDRSTFSPLKQETTAKVSGKLYSFLAKKLDLKPDEILLHKGTHPNNNSLIQACIYSNCKKSIGILNYYNNKSNIPFPQFVDDMVKPDIINGIKWASASQELYDVPINTAKEIFKSSDNEITYAYYKTVLENYFESAIMVIEYNEKKFKIESPRYKYFHAPRSNNNFMEGIVIIKFVSPGEITKYEPVILESGRPISGQAVFNIISQINKTVRLGFNTSLEINPDTRFKTLNVNSWSRDVNPPANFVDIFHRGIVIQKQILDGAGKLRGICVNNIFMWCQPSHPIEADIMEIGDKKFKYSIELDEAIALLYKIVLNFNENMITYKVIDQYPIIKDDKVQINNNDFKYFVDGIWLNVEGFSFYIPVESSTPKIISMEERINTKSYFEILDIDNNEFEMHDYNERLANIIVQLWQIMYSYSTFDDPHFFTLNMTHINTSFQGKKYVNINKISRRIPSPDEFEENKLEQEVKGRVDFGKFITKLANHYGKELFIYEDDHYKLIIDSEKSQRALLHQAKLIQKLKEAYFAEKGHEVLVVSAKGEIPRRLQWGFKYNGRLEYSNTLEQSFINRIPKLSVLLEIKTYFKEFYKYSSDFEVKGPNQRIFMSIEEFKDFNGYKQDEVEATLHTKIEELESYTGSRPFYYENENGQMFILQRVSLGDLDSALNVASIWDKNKINLGYYAEPIIGKVKNKKAVSASGLHGTKLIRSLDKKSDSSYIYIYFKEGVDKNNREGQTYAALLKVNSTSKFEISENSKCSI